MATSKRLREDDDEHRVSRKKVALFCRIEDPTRPPAWLKNKAGTSTMRAMERLGEEILFFHDYIQSTEDEHTARKDALEALLTYVNRLRPGTTHSIYGSFATLSYLPCGDMDVSLEIGAQRKSDAKGFLRRLYETVQHTGLAREAEFRPSASVPIVKMRAAFCGVEMDFSVKTKPQGDMVTYVNASFAATPSLKPLLLIVKLLAKNKGIDSVPLGGINSMTVFVMIKAYLQRRAHLRPDADNDPAQLLVDLIMYYAAFDFKHYGITTRNNKGIFTKKDYGIHFDKPLAVENPEEPGVNITPNPETRIDDIQDVFSVASVKLNTGLQKYAELVNDVYHQWSDRKSTERCLVTLLGLIVDFTNEMQEERLRLRAALSNGAFERLKTLASIAQVPPPYQHPYTLLSTPSPATVSYAVATRGAYCSSESSPAHVPLLHHSSAISAASEKGRNKKWPSFRGTIGLQHQARRLAGDDKTNTDHPGKAKEGEAQK